MKSFLNNQRCILLLGHQERLSALSTLCASGNMCWVFGNLQHCRTNFAYFKIKNKIDFKMGFKNWPL